MSLPISQQNKYFDYLRDIENKVSYRKENSEVALINKNAGVQKVKVSSDVFELIQKSIDLSKESDGAFSPILLPLVKLWGWDTGDIRVPRDEEIEKALLLCSLSDVELDKEKCTVFLKKKGMGFDLGGSAKGWASDKLLQKLKSDNVKSGIINLGGNVLVFGNRDFTIALQKPYKERGVYEITKNVKNKTIVTSGAYERGKQIDGIYYHHILSPFTGMSATEVNKSVSIITESSFVADVYATAIFVNPNLKEKFLSLYPNSEVIFQ